MIDSPAGSATARWALVVLALLAAPLHAQSAPGRLEGVVVDSAHARWPEGASVLAVRVDPPAHSAGTTVDNRGRYRIDSLPAGRYMVGFASPFLDSLEITLPPREITVESGRSTRADFAIPSGRTLRAAACPGLALAAGTGAVIGRVLDADSDAPLAGARVAFLWHETTFDSKTLRTETTDRSGAVTTDTVGIYRLCGVPTDDWVVLQVQHGGRAGADVRVLVPDSAGVAVRELSLSATASRPIAAAAVDTAPPPPLTGSAAVTGVVRGVGGLPLGDAQVRVLGARGTTVSDARGRFSLGDLPSGTQVLEVRRIGYLLAQQPVELRGGRSVVQDVQMRRIVTLDSVRVLAQRSLYRDFEFNRKANRFGKFFTVDSIERRHPLYASDVVRMLPGFRVVGFGLDARVVSSRGVSSLGGASSCEANIVIDGMTNQEINLINPYDIGAMEIYRPGEPAPMQYNRNQCGVIVIWSRRG